MSSNRTKVLLVFLENAVLTLSGVLLSVVFARSLGPTGLGDWKLVMSAKTFSVHLLGFGFAMLVTRYTAEFLQSARIGAMWQLLRITALISLVTVLISGLSYITASYFRHWSVESALFSPENAMLIALALGLNLINDVAGRAFLTGIGRRDWVALVQMSSHILLLSGVLTATLISQITLRLAVSLLIIGYLAELLLYLAAINYWKSGVNGNREERLTAHDRKRLLEFAGFQWLFRIFQSLREYAVDNFMLLVLKGIESVGIYGAAASAPGILRGIGPAKMLGGILLPKLVPRSAESESLTRKRTKFYFRFLQKLTAVLVWPLLAIVFVLAEEFLLLLFGSGFQAAATPMRILLLCMIPTIAADAFYSPALALEKSKLTFHVSFWGIANALLNLILIPRWGVIGAAIGTGTVGVGIYFHFYRAMKLHGWTMSFPWHGCSRVGVAIVLLVLPLLLTKCILNTYVSIIAALFIGLAGYLYSIRQFSPFETDEQAFLKREFGSITQLFLAQENTHVR